MTSTAELMDKGMKCLVEGLGVIEAEKFVYEVKNDNFDYTKWQSNLFEDMTSSELNERAVGYMKEHPFNGKNATIL